MRRKSHFFLLLIILTLSACSPPAAEVVTEPVAGQRDDGAPATESATPGELAAEGTALILATTTSTEDSGLLDFILPFLEAETGTKVNVIAVGTGQALELGANGDADVVMVHARAREDAFMEAGHGLRREDLMYNDFVILGPAGDPAGILGRNKAARAMEQIAAAEATFVSRGDDSGTHTKELEIWAAAGIDPSGDWYNAAGQGMGAVLTMADELQAYTMCDRATYLSRTPGGTTLEIMVEGDPILFNPYGVMVVNPAKGAHIQAELANQFVDWLISVPTQERIAEFGVEAFGSPLFTPDSQPYRQATGTATVSEADNGEKSAVVALRVTGLIEVEQAWAEADIKEMETITAEALNNSGSMDSYTGVAVNDLIALAGVQDNATAVAFITTSGEEVEVSLESLSSCTDCILSFRNQGGFSTTFPGFDDLPRLRDVVEVQVR